MPVPPTSSSCRSPRSWREPVGVTRFGTVVEFDPERGLGTVSAESGRYPFHCTELADGSRRIEVGTVVRFVELPKLGVVEAGRIEVVGRGRSG
jgi:hypothetical protein